MSDYLYNGVKLPALPEWDKTLYQKAMIHLWSKDEIRLVVFSDIDDVYAESSWWIEVNINAPWLEWTYDPESNTWGKMTDNGEYERYEVMVAGENMNLAIWSNFDVYVTTSHGDYYPVGMLAFAASEPIPVGTAPTIDPLSLFMGWKAGNWVARQRGKAKPPEEEKTPVAFLYNGVRLPDINAVWTDKETYPYSLIYLKDGFACLYLLTSEIFVNENNEVEVKNYGRVAISIMLSIGSGWSDIDERTIVDAYAGQIFCSVADFVYSIWTSHDILNADGTVYLAASEPVSVYE